MKLNFLFNPHLAVRILHEWMMVELMDVDTCVDWRYSSEERERSREVDKQSRRGDKGVLDAGADSASYLQSRAETETLGGYIKDYWFRVVFGEGVYAETTRGYGDQRFSAENRGDLRCGE